MLEIGETLRYCFGHIAFQQCLLAGLLQSLPENVFAAKNVCAHTSLCNAHNLFIRSSLHRSRVSEKSRDRIDCLHAEFSPFNSQPPL